MNLDFKMRARLNCIARHPFSVVRRAECEQDFLDLESQAIIQENMSSESDNWGSLPSIGGIPINTTVASSNIPTQSNVEPSVTTETKSSDWSMIGYISLAVAVILVGNYLITKKVK